MRGLGLAPRHLVPWSGRRRPADCGLVEDDRERDGARLDADVDEPDVELRGPLAKHVRRAPQIGDLARLEFGRPTSIGAVGEC